MSVLTIFILTGDQQVTSSSRIWSHIITSSTYYILHMLVVWSANGDGSALLRRVPSQFAQ